MVSMSLGRSYWTNSRVYIYIFKMFTQITYVLSTFAKHITFTKAKLSMRNNELTMTILQSIHPVWAEDEGYSAFHRKTGETTDMKRWYLVRIKMELAFVAVSMCKICQQFQELAALSVFPAQGRVLQLPISPQYINTILLYGCWELL